MLNQYLTIKTQKLFYFSNTIKIAKKCNETIRQLIACWKEKKFTASNAKNF